VGKMREENGYGRRMQTVVMTPFEKLIKFVLDATLWLFLVAVVVFL